MNLINIINTEFQKNNINIKLEIADIQNGIYEFLVHFKSNSSQPVLLCKINKSTIYDTDYLDLYLYEIFRILENTKVKSDDVYKIRKKYLKRKIMKTKEAKKILCFLDEFNSMVCQGLEEEYHHIKKIFKNIDVQDETFFNNVVAIYAYTLQRTIVFTYKAYEFQINFFKKYENIVGDEESYICLLHELELRNIYCGKEKNKFYYIIRFLMLISMLITIQYSLTITFIFFVSSICVFYLDYLVSINFQKYRVMAGLFYQIFFMIFFIGTILTLIWDYL